jgi:hypothetical protein
MSMWMSFKALTSVEGIQICVEGVAIAVPHVIAITKPAAARILVSFIFPLLFIVDFER